MHEHKLKHEHEHANWRHNVNRHTGPKPPVAASGRGQRQYRGTTKSSIVVKSIGSALVTVLLCGLALTNPATATARDSSTTRSPFSSAQDAGGSIRLVDDEQQSRSCDNSGDDDNGSPFGPSVVGGETPIGDTLSDTLSLYSPDKKEWTRAKFETTRLQRGINYKLSIYDMQTYGFTWLTPFKFIPYVIIFSGSPMWSYKKDGVELRLEAKFTLFRNGTEIDSNHPTVTGSGTTLTLEGFLPTERYPGSYDVGVTALLVPNTANPDRSIPISNRLGTICIP